MRDITLDIADRLLRSADLTLIRRGADGSLVMSTDRWRLASRDAHVLRFVALPPAPPSLDPLMLALDRVARVTWDRLARQRTRSQVRFHLHGGDVWTFSGHIDLPDAP